jgi:hypothetical protein
MAAATNTHREHVRSVEQTGNRPALPPAGALFQESP